MSPIRETALTAITDHWLTDARRVKSPNFNARPCGVTIDLLVIHNISLPVGQFGGGYIEALFTNCLDCREHPDFADLAGLEVSAHVLIDRRGTVTQFVPFDERAWHAGVSRHRGRDNCNDFSIGIELEGTDDKPYTELQYKRLVEITAVLMRAYPGLRADNVVGHCDIAPGRKTDPGPAFDWTYFRAQLANLKNADNDNV